MAALLKRKQTTALDDAREALEAALKRRAQAQQKLDAIDDQKIARLEKVAAEADQNRRRTLERYAVGEVSEAQLREANQRHEAAKKRLDEIRAGANEMREAAERVIENLDERDLPRLTRVYNAALRECLTDEANRLTEKMRRQSGESMIDLLALIYLRDGRAYHNDVMDSVFGTREQLKHAIAERIAKFRTIYGERVD